MQRIRTAALAKNRPVSTQLKRLGESEARIIGNNLMPALKSNKTAAAGIDLWRRQNKAVDDLLTEYPWMQGFFVALGQDVIKAAPWGLKWR